MRRVRRKIAVVDKAVYLASLHGRTGRDPILVFTMGKVGSTALADSVASATGRSVLKFHRATPAGIRRSSALWREEGSDRRPHEDWVGWYARQRLRARRRGPRWQVLTGVRDPVAQLVSATFQVGPALGVFDPDAPPSLVDLERVQRRVLAFATPGREPWDWFEQELAPITGVDVLAGNFPVEAGWATYEGPRCRVLLLRTEDLPRVAPVALGQFLGLERPVALDLKNVGAQKSYADLYRRFVAEVSLPTALLDRAYGSAMAQHFYTPDELEAFRERWMRP